MRNRQQYEISPKKVSRLGGGMIRCKRSKSANRECPNSDKVIKERLRQTQGKREENYGTHKSHNSQPLKT